MRGKPLFQMQSRLTGLHVPPRRHASPGAKHMLNPKAIAQHPFPQSLSVVQKLKPASASFGRHEPVLALHVAVDPHEVHAAPAVPWPQTEFVI